MIQVSEKARDKLIESLKDQGQNPSVRIYVAGSG